MIQVVFSEFQDQLMRGLAHRMNNILSLFHCYLGLLMDDRNLDPVTKEGLTRIRNGATEAADLMERINAISRPPSGVLLEMDPAAFFRQIAPTLDGLRKPETRLEVSCPAGLPLMCGDTSRTKLAIIELVRNACEAARSQVTVVVTAEKGAEQPELFPSGSGAGTGEWLKIQVIDDGAGIAAADATRIYEPFYSTKKKNQYAGLGLAVALGCAQQVGGALRHQSGKRGTVFEMLLPARAPRLLSAVA
jgi:signal transduction histidine kinase